MKWLMLQPDEPEDIVIATGETHSVREFLETAFSYVDLDCNEYLNIADELYRPSEVHLLQGDASKAHKKLSLHPNVSFEEPYSGNG